MNVDEVTTLLDRLGTQVEVGSPPINGIFEDGGRVKRRRRWLQVAGSAAVVFLLGLGGYVLKPEPGVPTATTPTPTPGMTSGATGLLAPPGTRLVGEGGVVVAVPQTWTTNDIGCGDTAASDTVTFNDDGPWFACLGPGSHASVLSVADRTSSQWDTRLRLTATAVSIDGMQALRSPTACTRPVRGATCSATLTFPDQGVSFLLTSSDERLVNRVLDNARRLPGGFVNVPDVSTMSAAEARHTLAAQGLKMDPPCLTGECRRYVVRTDPVVGSAVSTSSTVSVIFFEPGIHQGGSGDLAERMTTHVGGVTIQVWFPRETVTSGRLLRSRMLIENRTARPVRFDSCSRGNPHYALQSVGSTHIEWHQVVVDCSGPRVLAPGFTSRSSGPWFYASTRTGNPLQAGSYYAIVDFGGGSPWIRHQISVLPAQ